MQDLRADVDATFLRDAAAGVGAAARRRLVAVARVYEGLGVAEAAREADVEVTTLRRWIQILNEEGIESLSSEGLNLGAPYDLRSDYDAAAVRRLAETQTSSGGRARLIAIAMMYDGVPTDEIRRTMGVSEQTLRGWRSDFNHAHYRPVPEEIEAPVERLYAKNRYWPARRIAALAPKTAEDEVRLKAVLGSLAGRTVEAVAGEIGRSRSLVTSWIRIFNASGARALLSQNDRPAAGRKAKTRKAARRAKPKPSTPSKKVRPPAFELPFSPEELLGAAEAALTRSRKTLLQALAAVVDGMAIDEAAAAHRIRPEGLRVAGRDVGRLGPAGFARSGLRDDFDAGQIRQRAATCGDAETSKRLEFIAAIHEGATIPQTAARFGLTEAAALSLLSRFTKSGFEAFAATRAAGPWPKTLIRVLPVVDAKESEGAAVSSPPPSEQIADTAALEAGSPRIVASPSASPIPSPLPPPPGPAERLKWEMERLVEIGSSPPRSWEELSDKDVEDLEADDDVAAGIRPSFPVGEEELELLVESAVDDVQRRRLTAMSHLARGFPVRWVADGASCRPSDVILWSVAFRMKGPAALLDDPSSIERLRPRLSNSKMSRLRKRDPEAAIAAQAVRDGGYPPVVAAGSGMSASVLRSTVEKTSGRDDRSHAPVAAARIKKAPSPEKHYTPFQRFVLGCVLDATRGVARPSQICATRGVPEETMFRWMSVHAAHGVEGLASSCAPDLDELPAGFTSASIRQEIASESFMPRKRALAALALVYDGAPFGEAASLTEIDPSQIEEFFAAFLADAPGDDEPDADTPSLR